MKDYKKLFAKFWGYCESDIPMCWSCYREVAVDIHHLTPKGMGGVKNNRLNRPDNLFPVCRNCHTLAHKNKFVNEQFKIYLKDKIANKEVEDAKKSII